MGGSGVLPSEHDVVPVNDFVTYVVLDPLGNLVALPTCKSSDIRGVVPRKTTSKLGTRLAHDRDRVTGIERTRHRDHPGGQQARFAFLPRLGAAMSEKGVELHADGRAAAYLDGAKRASAEDWDTEYLDLILNVGDVDGIDGAIEHVAKHGSNHTEAIVTENDANGQRWLREVDASLVLVNASTRFNDGFALGLGAEIGISTTKLHAYGPMGLAELCTLKWVGQGEGQVRQ